MENDSPFRPGGATFTLTAAVSPPTPVQASGPAAGDVSYLISNLGSTWVFLAFGATASACTANAVKPTGGTPQSVIPVAPNGSIILTLPPLQFFTAVADSATDIIYITPGNGA